MKLNLQYKINSIIKNKVSNIKLNVQYQLKCTISNKTYNIQYKIKKICAERLNHGFLLV